MNAGEHPPASEPENAPGDRSTPPVSVTLMRNLAIVLVIVAVVFGFGRPLAAGYYFGGCDEAEETQHYLIHVFGVTMCRDVALAGAAEAKARREAEAGPTQETEAEEEAAPSPEGGSSSPASREKAPA
jgi:hypothetical protein